MKTLKIMCGLPRSGKSSWIENNKTNEVVLSADNLRYLVYNQRFWNDGEPLMWSLHSVILKMLLQQGNDIIIDETNTTPKRRQPIIKIAKDHGYTVECVYITTPKEACLERAIKLNDDIIQPVIERMSNEFIEPDVSEGFDSITRI